MGISCVMGTFAEVSVRSFSAEAESSSSSDSEDDWADARKLGTASLLGDRTLLPAKAIDDRCSSVATLLEMQISCDGAEEVAESNHPTSPEQVSPGRLLLGNWTPSHVEPGEESWGFAEDSNVSAERSKENIAPICERENAAPDCRCTTDSTTISPKLAFPSRVDPQAQLPAGPVDACKVFVPPLRQGRCTSPPPKSGAGVRRSPREQAQAMVPMMRVKHMEFLDEQYLKDVDIRPDTSRSASGARISKSAAAAKRKEIEMAPMLRARHMELLDEQYLKDAGVRPDTSRSASGARTARAAAKSRQKSSQGRPSTLHSLPSESAPVSRNSDPHCRPLGPKAVMPLLKGRLKVEADTAQREAERKARDERLKEQFRLRPSSRSRSKNQVSKK